MVSDNGVSCYVPCLQNSTDDVSYDLKPISTCVFPLRRILSRSNFSFSLEFHASKLFTQKGSGYFHVFNATLCGQKPVTCQKEMDPQEKRRSSNPSKIESQLCRMGVVPNANGSSVTYLDEFVFSLFSSRPFSTFDLQFRRRIGQRFVFHFEIFSATAFGFQLDGFDVDLPGEFLRSIDLFVPHHLDFAALRSDDRRRTSTKRFEQIYFTNAERLFDGHVRRMSLSFSSPHAVRLSDL